jgi:hypothetical protein
MKKTRLRYDQEFKTSVVAELEGGKTGLQVTLTWIPRSFGPV